MKLEHSFTVPTGIDEAWRILLDIEQIGPCMPGAAIDSVDGDDFTGTVKVKLGPIGLTYKGKASFIEKDEATHRAVIDARGRDSRGNGTAAAKVTAVLEDQGGSTLVKVDTDLDITGKPAQFGRGVMVDVGNKLIGQFADNLATTIRSGEGSAEAPVETPTAPARKRTARPKPTPATAESSGSADEAPVIDGTAEPEAPTAVEAVATAGPIERAAVEAVAAGPGYSAPSEPTASDDAPHESADDAAGGVNGHEPKRPFTPPREVEPINLIESAGPAVAKRLAPVAAALLVLLIVLRRRAKH
ncbi:SRPBCC domain-containing protein [uncultured Jatrophihabitans sp.]|uniref:SRPBCC family protein n=1 Tax=uncultured Jatrophihabitans sp. TaxID=1610747 RepID=UPI0035CC7D34